MWSDLKKGRNSQLNGEYFITFNCRNQEKLFNNYKLANIFCRQIAINENKLHCQWLTWVLMPDHFHGLLRLKEVELGKVIAHLKGASSRLLNTNRNQQGAIWQPAYYDHALRNEEDRVAISRYIIANPLRKKPGKSSALLSILEFGLFITVKDGINTDLGFHLARFHLAMVI